MQNDHFDHLLANNQIKTLNRDVQQLNLASNNITTLRRAEFARKQFKNLQKIYLTSNQLQHVDFGAFRKLTGLVELDLSENLIERFDESLEMKVGGLAGDDEEQEDEEEAEEAQVQANQSARQKKSSRKLATRTFLGALRSVRQLNLNSNQLTRIEKFAFSPLGQLRQLSLSK